MCIISHAFTLYDRTRLKILFFSGITPGKVVALGDIRRASDRDFSARNWISTKTGEGKVIPLNVIDILVAEGKAKPFVFHNRPG